MSNEEYYLAIEKEGLFRAAHSPIPVLMSMKPQEAFLYLFDTAYAMGFGAAKQMQKDGIDIQAFNPAELSLIPKQP